jgi:hypothetical protein
VTLLRSTLESRLRAGVTSLRLPVDPTTKSTTEAIAKPPPEAHYYRRLCAGDDPMESSSADFSTTLNRILDTAADNLRIAKALAQMGLDPNNITYDALFNRLLEIVLANITLANLFALVGAIFFVATLLMQTMVPLRVANMAGLRSSSPLARSPETSELFSCICCCCRSMQFASVKCAI